MALIECPECGKEISSMAKSCPNCGYPIDGNISGNNQHGSTCQEPPVAVVQRNRKGRNSIIAMSMCIVSLILYIISDCYSVLVVHNKYISLPAEAYATWVSDHAIEFIIFNLMATIASLCVISAWLIWFLREKNKNVTLIVGTIICCASLLVRAISVIPAPIFFNFLNFDASTYIDFFSYQRLTNSFLSLALGITLLLLNYSGKIKKLTVAVGLLFVLFYLHGCIISAFDIAHIEHPITDTTIYIVIVDLFFYILLTFTILLFYNTHKQEGVSSSQHGIEHSQQDYGVRRSTKSAGSTALIITIMTVLILAFLSVFAWVALAPHHSKTYKECMRSCERQETAIKNAKSLNDMERINNRIIGFTEYESLEGDERVDVYRRHEEVWDLFNERCEQVAVGKYKLVSEEGQTYIVEVTNKIIKDNGFSKRYLVNIYKNNQLHCTGDWGLNGTEIRIFPQFKENTLASISMWPKSNTANTYGWHGDIEEEWNLHNNDGTAEKISEQ